MQDRSPPVPGAIRDPPAATAQATPDPSPPVPKKSLRTQGSPGPRGQDHGRTSSGVRRRPDYVIYRRHSTLDNAHNYTQASSISSLFKTLGLLRVSRHKITINQNQWSPKEPPVADARVPMRNVPISIKIKDVREVLDFWHEDGATTATAWRVRVWYYFIYYVVYLLPES